MRSTIIFLFSILTFYSFGQTKESCEKLSNDLNEISGLALFQDTLLITMNDSGNKPQLFFINFKGKLVYTCRITNAKNNDWEDLTIDSKGFGIS